MKTSNPWFIIIILLTLFGCYSINEDHSLGELDGKTIASDTDTDTDTDSDADSDTDTDSDADSDTDTDTDTSTDTDADADTAPYTGCDTVADFGIEDSDTLTDTDTSWHQPTNTEISNSILQELQRLGTAPVGALLMVRKEKYQHEILDKQLLSGGAEPICAQGGYNLHCFDGKILEWAIVPVQGTCEEGDQNLAIDAFIATRGSEIACVYLVSIGRAMGSWAAANDSCDFDDHSMYDFYLRDNGYKELKRLGLTPKQTTIIVDRDESFTDLEKNTDWGLWLDMCAYYGYDLSNLTGKAIDVSTFYIEGSCGDENISSTFISEKGAKGDPIDCAVISNGGGIIIDIPSHLLTFSIDDPICEF